MSLYNNKNIEVLDCTLRDGGYVNKWDFDIKVARETYRALSKAGVDIVELGYHGTEKYFEASKYGLFRFCSAQTVDEVTKGIDGARLALMVDLGKFEVEDLKQYKNSKVSIIRIAFHKNKLKEAFEKITDIRQLGFKVSVNLMGYANYTEEEKSLAVDLMQRYKPDYVYFADTYGSLFPDEVEALFRKADPIPGVVYGFHPHNNLQMGFADSLAAIKGGAKIVDSSIFGMGRGAGNLPTEIMISYLQQSRPEKYNCIPVLNLIDKYFSELHKEHDWGYGLPYMISGIKSCHPDYATNLVARKEYDIEEMWDIIGVIKSFSPVGFDKLLFENILKKGLFGRKTSPVNGSGNISNLLKREDKVNYIGRHKGKDFLIIANGPSLAENMDRLQAFIKKYDPVVMAGNFVGNMIKPRYHGFNNKRRFIEYINSADKDAVLMLGEYLDEKTIREYTERPYERIYYEDSSEAPFDIKDGVVSSNCRTIALLLAGVAVVMGAKRIFIAGLDGYMNLNSKKLSHFYEEKDETGDSDLIKEKHYQNQRYLDEIDRYLIGLGKEGLHIITPTDYNNYYKGIDNYLQQKKEGEK